MGRGKRDFYLIRRKDRLTRDSSGKLRPTYYCRFRDDSTGELTAWHSTGETSVGRAEIWVHSRLKDDQLQASPTLEYFAKDFFRWESSPWIRKQHAKGRRFSESVASGRQGHLDNYIIPHFGKVKLTELTQKKIEDWLSGLDLSNQTRNHILYTFRIVLREARFDGKLKSNPLETPEPFGVDWKVRHPFTLAELHALFPDDPAKLTKIWTDQEHATALLLLADTGMRSGECRGLRWLHYIGGKALYIDSAVDKAGQAKGTKTGASRLVPVSEKARAALERWRAVSKYTEPDDFVFSKAKGAPHGDKWLIRVLPAALEEAKVKPAGRTLVVHSFRHTYVTLMEKTLAPGAVQALSGHATEKARKLYSHPSVEDLMGKLGPAQEAVEKLWK